MTPEVGRPAPGRPAGDRPRHPARPLPGRPRGRSRRRPGVPVELGPEDLRDLPRLFGQADDRLEGYGGVRHRDPRRDQPRPPARPAPSSSPRPTGSSPRGPTGSTSAATPAAPGRASATPSRPCVDRGYRVSIDSFDPVEVARGRRRRGRPRPERQRLQPRARRRLGRRGRGDPRRRRDARRARRDRRLPRRPGRPATGIDPILEPIGFGFAASWAATSRPAGDSPTAPMLMGVGNLTELTDVDSAGSTPC